MRRKQIAKRLFCLTAAIFLLQALIPTPVLAEEEPEIEIVWLDAGYQPTAYNREFDWVSCIYMIDSDHFDRNDLYAVFEAATGKKVSEYKSIGPFSDGLALVSFLDAEGNMRTGYIDQSKELKFEIKDNITAFDNYSEDRAPVLKVSGPGILFGFVDRSGELVVPVEYDYAKPFSEGRACVAKRNEDGVLKYGYIDKNGAVVIPLEYEMPESDSFGYDYWSFHDGLALVAKNDTQGRLKYGFIDRDGRIVIPLEYDRGWGFSEGLAMVTKVTEDGSRKGGYIDTKGKTVIPFEYDMAYPFSCGLAFVYKGENYAVVGENGVIDSGEPVLSVIDKSENAVEGFPLDYNYDYQYPTMFFDGLICAESDGKFGFIDTEGNTVLPIEYDRVGFLPEPDGSSMFCWVQKGLNYGVFRNPCHSTKTDNGDAAVSGVGTQTAPTAPSSGGNAAATVSPDAAKESKGGSPLTVVLAVVAVVAIAAVAVLLVLLTRKKKAPIMVTPAAQPPMSASPAAQVTVAEAIFCPSCGAKAEPGAAFCPACGKEIPRRGK